MNLIETLVALATKTNDNVGMIRDLILSERAEIATTAAAAWRACREATKGKGKDGADIAAPTGGLLHAHAQAETLVRLGVIPEDKRETALLALCWTENGSGWKQIYEPADKKTAAPAEKPTLSKLFS